MCLINFKLHKIKAQPFEFCRHQAQDSRIQSFQVPILYIHDSQEGHLKFFFLFVCLLGYNNIFFFITNQIFLQRGSSIQSLWEEPEPAELIYLVIKHSYGSQILTRTRRHQEKSIAHTCSTLYLVCFFLISIINKGNLARFLNPLDLSHESSGEEAIESSRKVTGQTFCPSYCWFSQAATAEVSERGDISCTSPCCVPRSLTKLLPNRVGSKAKTCSPQKAFSVVFCQSLT